MKRAVLVAALGGVFAIGLGVHLRGQTAPPPRSIVAIRCGRIYPVSSAPFDRGIILVENGIIVDVLRGDQVPEGATVVDASDQFVIPGLVDGSTWLAGNGASEETISPEVRSVDGIDFYRTRRSVLAGGVTAAYVAPSAKRLVGGQGAVVKTAGHSRVLRETYGLHVVLGNAVKSPPGLYRPPILPSADNPILPARKQYPATRMGEFAELRKAFETAKNARVDRRNGWTKERLAPFAVLFSGKEPIVVSAAAADDMVKAVLLAEETKLKVVLVDATESYRIADFLAEHRVPVVLRASYAPRRGYGADDHRHAGEARPDLRAAATLSRAGVRLALDCEEDDDLGDLLFIAGSAVRWGLPEEEALRAITLNPAEFLGIADRAGSIEKGKDADLVFLNGEPFQAASVPQRVMVDGETVFERKPSDARTYDVALADASRSKKKDVLAIRAGKILSVSQGVILDGMVLVDGGKIVYVGKGRPIPQGAKVIDASKDVLVPGMIDLNSHLGFHLDQGESDPGRGGGAYRIFIQGEEVFFEETWGGGGAEAVPQQARTAVSKLVRLDDPAFRDAAAGGVTSILLTPRANGPCSVLKLSGEADAVVREVGAYKFTVGGGTGEQERLRQQLQRAKKYHEEWEAYEKSLKEKKEAPKPTEGVEQKPDPISGTWKGTMEIPDYNMRSEFAADFKLAGTKVTGTVTTEMGGKSETESVEGTFVNEELKIGGNKEGAQYDITMKLDAPNHLKGTWQVSMQGMKMSGPIECTRIAGGEGQPASAPKAGEKKEPKKDEALEPFRPLFRKEIPALLEVRDYAGVETAMKIFRDEFDLDTVVGGAADARHLGELLVAKTASVALGPDFLLEKRGAFVNVAEALASAGVPVAFYSDETSGTKLLPCVAAYAVRYGMDPFDALKALTLNPAKMLGLEGRIGSIERGHDADLVVLSGDPLNLNSRVKKVFVSGKIVFEAGE